MHDCSNSSANALELPQSCTKPSISAKGYKSGIRKIRWNEFLSMPMCLCFTLSPLWAEALDWPLMDWCVIYPVAVVCVPCLYSYMDAWGVWGWLARDQGYMAENWLPSNYHLQKRFQSVSNKPLELCLSPLEVWATFFGSHLIREPTASPLLTKWNWELMLATNFGNPCTNGYQSWLPTLVLYQTVESIILRTSADTNQ